MEEKNSLHTFEFTGNSLTFFKIWIVNILLSIITLGIYSPWAKVRTNSYIYGNTFLNGNGFEYTANPMRILIGRLIVVGTYFIYYVLSDVLGLVTFALIFLLAFLLLIPWFVRQAVAFRMRYTRYRGINFRHFATVFEYYKFFLIHLILNIVTIGLAFPYTYKEFKNLTISNTSYGDKNLNFYGKTSQFYILYLKYFALSILLFVIIGLVSSGFLYSSFDSIKEIGSVKNPQDLSKDSINGIIRFAFAFYAIAIIFGTATKGFWDAWVGNIIFNHLNLDKFSLKSDWRGFKLAWIYFSNFILIIFSIGLLYPYSKIRTIRHKVSHTYISGDGFDEFVNVAQEDTKALGEETAEFFDFDIGV